MLLKLPCLDVYQNLPVIITYFGVVWFCFFGLVFFLILVHHKISNALNYAFGNSCEITFLLLIYISIIFQVNVYFIHIIDFKIFQKDQRNTRSYCEVIGFHHDLARIHGKVILLLILSTKLAFTSYSIKKNPKAMSHLHACLHTS